MPEPLKAAALRGLRTDGQPIVVVDPGESCGVLTRTISDIVVATLPLADLPGWLRYHVADAAFVVCEDYHILSGRAKQQAGSRVPSAIGIGMVRTACEWTDTEMILVAPNVKRAGFLALNAAGLAAYNACRNDHERDAVSIAGYVQREMRRLA